MKRFACSDLGEQTALMAVQRLLTANLINRTSQGQGNEDRFTMLPMTRDYLLVEVAHVPEWEPPARARWLQYYLRFTQTHGGMDWEEWWTGFDVLQREWGNIQAVCAWCAAHEDQGGYACINTLWRDDHLGYFTDLYGYWAERLSWLDWLTQAAERRNDWPTVARAYSDKGWTHILMAQFAEAEQALDQAWRAHHWADPRTQHDIANNLVVLWLEQEDYPKAKTAFEREKEVTASLDHAQTEGWDERERARQQATSLYYEAQLWCKDPAGQDYDRAKRLFQQMIAIASSIGWARGVNYPQNWLADIAIASGDLDQAEPLLRAGLQEAERKHDKRRIAHYKSSWARWEQQKGASAEARRWALEALDGFTKLRMRKEAASLRRLVQECERADEGSEVTDQ